MSNVIRAIIRRLVWLTARTETIEERLNIMTTNQEHLDQDVAEIDAKFSDAIQHLKDQIAAGTPAEQLDFSRADALVSKADAEDVTDNPPAPEPTPAPVDQPVDQPVDNPPAA